MTDSNIELLSLLYELSLTTIRHSEVKDVSHKFVKKFLSRRALEYGAVWLIDREDNHQYQLHTIYAIPQLQEEGVIKKSNFNREFGKGTLAIMNRSLFEGERPKGTYAYFNLDDFGLLELYTKKSNENLNFSSLNPFLDVVKQFSNNLQASFTFKELHELGRQQEIAQKSLERNEIKYRRIIESIDLGLLEVDEKEVIQFANKPFLDLVGYDLDEIVGKQASSLFLDGSSKRKVDEEHKIRKEGKSSSYELAIRDKSGMIKWVMISGAPNYDENDKIIGSIGIHLDITHLKDLQKDNVFKDNQLKKLIESSLDALISINEKGEIFEWSPQAENIFGYSFKEIKGKLLSDTIIPHTHRNAHKSGLNNYLKTGHGPVLNSRIEITALRKNGEEFPIELTIFPLKHEDKHYFTAFVRDISELKKSKDSMEKALNRQRELNNLKSQFISMTSHELRTPLTTVSINTELIREQIISKRKLNVERLTKNLQRIEFNVDRLTQLINNILMMGQLDSQKVPFTPKLVDVFDLIANKLLLDYSTRGLDISCAKSGDSFPIMLDEKLFAQIINNILENAIKYSEGKPSPEITLTFLKELLQIDIIDHGIGIPNQDIDKLFSTFFRASNVGNIQGTGLGLAIVNEFVKIHGGEIKVNSEIGKGTTFSLLFPRN